LAQRRKIWSDPELYLYALQVVLSKYLEDQVDRYQWQSNNHAMSSINNFNTLGHVITQDRLTLSTGPWFDIAIENSTAIKIADSKVAQRTARSIVSYIMIHLLESKHQKKPSKQTRTEGMKVNQAQKSHQKPKENESPTHTIITIVTLIRQISSPTHST
jgi:hypothetical protein